MSVLTMRRHSDDNEYLHRDFHASIDNAIAYIGDNFGEQAVRDYLSRYVKSRYKKMSLEELRDYFTEIYKAEHFGDKLTTELSGDRLKIAVAACPGIDYFKSTGSKPSKWYGMTTTVLYDELAEHCGFDFRLDHYDDETGKAEFVFIKKAVEK